MTDQRVEYNDSFCIQFKTKVSVVLNRLITIVQMGKVWDEHMHPEEKDALLYALAESFIYFFI